MNQHQIPRFENRRTSKRQEVNLPGEVVHGSQIARTVIVDVSAHGCHVTGFHGDLTIGAPTGVRLAGLGPFTAWVRWVQDGEVGLEFAMALPQPLVARLAMMQSVPVHFPHAA